MVASTNITFTLDWDRTGVCRLTIHWIPPFVFWTLWIPDTTNNKKSASTFNQDTDVDALSKIVSFKYMLVMSNKETLTLKLIVKGSLAVAVNHSKNEMTLHQNIGRKSLWYVQLQIGHDVQLPIASIESSKPVDKYISPRTCSQPKSRQKNHITSCSSSNVQARNCFLAEGPSA